MDIDNIISIAVAVIAAAASITAAILSYNAARKKVEDELKTIREQENLSIRKEAKLFEYKANFGQIQEITAAFVPLLRDVYALFPRGIEFVPRDEDERKKADQEKYERACSSHNAALSLLQAGAPFLSKERYEEGLWLLRQCNLRITSFLCVKTNPENATLGTSVDFYEKTAEIETAIEIWNDHLREDLDTQQLAVV